MTDLLRLELAQCGYTEALTFTLCSKEDVSTKLGKKLETVDACIIANPKTTEFQVSFLSKYLRMVYSFSFFVCLEGCQNNFTFWFTQNG